MIESEERVTSLVLDEVGSVLGSATPEGARRRGPVVLVEINTTGAVSTIRHREAVKLGMGAKTTTKIPIGLHDPQYLARLILRKPMTDNSGPASWVVE